MGTSLTDLTADACHRRKRSSRRTRFKYGPDSDRYPSSWSCCTKRNALITDTLAARASCDAFLYWPRGAESNSSGTSGASSTFSIHWFRSENRLPETRGDFDAIEDLC